MEKKIALEFTTTACNRPEILNRTYASYCSKLQGVDFKASILYINIDPSPTVNNIEAVEKIAKKYFGTVIVNLPSTANFAKAIIWCFSQVRGPYFFHLEDDWELLRPVNLHMLISVLGSSNLQCVLNKKKTSIGLKEAGEPTFVPSVFSTAHLKKYLPHMVDNLNPEHQMKLNFKNKKNKLYLHKSVVVNQQFEFSKDIGRSWLSQNKLIRNYTKPKKWSPWITWKKQ